MADDMQIVLSAFAADRGALSLPRRLAHKITDSVLQNDSAVISPKNLIRRIAIAHGQRGQSPAGWGLRNPDVMPQGQATARHAANPNREAIRPFGVVSVIADIEGESEYYLG